MHGLAPTYLSMLIEEYHPSRNLRSSSQKLLKKKVVKFERLGKKCFAFSAPEVWNSLPFHLRSEKSLEIFKNNLKTFYFKEAFYWIFYSILNSVASFAFTFYISIYFHFPYNICCLWNHFCLLPSGACKWIRKCVLFMRRPAAVVNSCVFHDSTAGFYTFVNHLNSLIYITLHNMYIFTTIYIIENFTPFHIFEDLWWHITL